MRKLSETVTNLDEFNIAEPAFAEVRTHGLCESIFVNCSEKATPSNEAALTLYAVNDFDSNKIFHRPRYFPLKRNSSTRRLRAFPAAVVLGATGLEYPYPIGTSRARAM